MKELYEQLNDILPKFISINYPDFIEDTEDIIHEVFIKIIRNSNYDESKGLRSTYYTNICKNHIIDLTRKRNTRIRHKSAFKREYKFKLKTTKETKQDNFLENYIIDRLSEFLKNDPYQYLKIVELRLKGYTVKEIQKKLNLKSVNKHYSNAKLLILLVIKGDQKIIDYIQRKEKNLYKRII